MLQFYSNNNRLENAHRDAIIQIIIEEANCENVFLKPSDFSGIVDEILSVFPNEKDAKVRANLL